jgi:dihydropteroate synthase
MHMRGDPRSMQEQPVYRFAPLDVFDALEQRVEACLAAGISRRNLAVDVGIGFAKSVNHNAQILNRLALYHAIGCAQLLGVSRKSYIGRLSKGEVPTERLPGSLATAVMAASQGVQIIRVHDVVETVQALTVWRALSQAVVPPESF